MFCILYYFMCSSYLVVEYKIYTSVWYSVHTVNHAHVFGLFVRHTNVEILNQLKTINY